MEFLEKIETANEDLFWNIPEQAQGSVNIIGGSSQSFHTPIKVAEFLGAKYPVQSINVVLPDTLKNKLPALENLVFLSSTDSGSLANGAEILTKTNAADYNLVIGDLSKNSITAKALAEVCKKNATPLLITRDAVDLLSSVVAETTLMNENLIMMASMVQLQKLFRAIYYPKMLMLAAPLGNVAEAMHKFTLSYPVAIITLHNGQILVAKNGKVATTGLEKTAFSPISFWSGELAAKIVALNLYNPNNFINATIAAIISARY